MRTNIRRSDIETNDMHLPLEHWEYGNPEAVAERRQARSCHGCRHEGKVQMGWNNIEYCEKGRKHGVRCAFFKTREIKQGNMTNEV